MINDIINLIFLNPKILIVTPFRNEDHSVSQYLEALKAVDYPKKLIDLYWLENDSSDKTLSMLKAAKGGMPFNSTTLESVKIIGSLQKNKPGDYFKDIGFGHRRGKVWVIIWNKYFIPLARKVKHKYILFWYADALAPPNVITEYLKVFDKYPAGWVGGKMRRRFPRHKHVLSPWPSGFALSKSKEPLVCRLTGHVFMIPRESLSKCECNYNPKEVHYAIINGLKAQGLKVYYQPTVYIPHVSMDGKIHGAPL